MDQRTVGEHDVEFLGVGVGDAVPNRVCARGVVADAAADRGTVRGGGVGGEFESVRGERCVEVVLHDAGLDAGLPALGVDGEDIVQLLREVEHDTARPDRLSRQRRPGPTRKNRDVVLGGDADRRPDVVDVARDDDTGRTSLVDAAVRRVEQLAVLVESDVAVDVLAEVGGE